MRIGFWLLGLSGCRAQPPPVRPGVDCDHLPASPLASEPFPAVANEDIAFDGEGNLVGADFATTLWSTDLSGNAKPIMPSSGVEAGLRLMGWDGTLASAQYATNAIFRINPKTGSKELLVGGLSTPSGIEIGDDHSVWFGELNGDRVQRYDADTRTLHVIASGIGRPNGLTFNRSYDRLYVAATGEGHIYEIDIDPLTKEPIGERRVFIADAGNGIDGLSVDACGNLYAGWWSEARIDRYTAEGVGPETLVYEPYSNFGLGNFAWGEEAFGWEPTDIYAVEFGNDTVRRIQLGVGEKPRLH